MKTPACKNEFPSECRLQTRFTFYNDILTTMVALKSEGDSKCSSKATSHTRAIESFDFMISLVIVLNHLILL